MEGDRKPYPFIKTAANEDRAKFSPDVGWIAYTSDESGRDEVYVTDFPTPHAKWRVSTNGGAGPRWRGDGKELFYIAEDGQLMAVPINPGKTFEIGTAAALFKAGHYDHSVTADGQRFLLNVPRVPDSSPVVVIANWTSMLKR